MKVSGPAAAVRTAIEAGPTRAEKMGGSPVADIIPRPIPMR